MREANGIASVFAVAASPVGVLVGDGLKCLLEVMMARGALKGHLSSAVSVGGLSV